jgi:pyridinium-3,5-bisthiocarboxylic acid mononucleotide nickel chelatase
MNFIYFECIAGVSGDMILGAFLDGLVPYDYLSNELHKLKVSGYTLELNDTLKHHISAKKFNVIYRDTSSHRHLKDIIALIDESTLSPYIKENSIAVFKLLGEQEAQIHNIAIEKVHFHEVGAIDSIIDIVGAFICLEYVSPQLIYSSELPVSKGFIKAAHGTLPVPAPATLAILKDYPLKSVDIDGELVTPTGAALIKHFSQGLLPSDAVFQIEKLGYGAGSKDFETLPNFIRIWQGSQTKSSPAETMIQLDTNIDDMNPEIYPFILEKLYEAGINDAWLTNVIMKHGRPGSQISVLLKADLLGKVKQIIFNETTTIGFRYHQVNREILKRKVKQIDSPWGKVQIKETEFNGEKKAYPEYKECERIAHANNVSIGQVYDTIKALLIKAN